MKKLKLEKTKIIFIILSLFLAFVFFPKVDYQSPTNQKQEIKKNIITEILKPSRIPTITPTLTPSLTPFPTPIFYSVVNVIDGDTFDVDIDGKIKRIRVIGINTPEVVDPRKKVECFGKEASEKAKELLFNKKVRLESDPTQGNVDKYGRLLRYVFLEDGTDFGLLMIKEGYAYEYTYNIPYKYQQQYKNAQKQAQENKRGLWAENACVTSNVLIPTSNIINQTTSSNCQYSCSGPDRDCSDFKTQAEAQAFFNCCGFTTTYDPMNLDNVGIGDGIACESLP